MKTLQLGQIIVTAGPDFFVFIFWACSPSLLASAWDISTLVLSRGPRTLTFVIVPVGPASVTFSFQSVCPGQSILSWEGSGENGWFSPKRVLPSSFDR